MELKIKIKNQEKVEPVKLKTPLYNEKFFILSASINSNGESSDGKKLFPVYVSQDVYDAIWKHARCDMRNEVGGALIGFYCRDETSEIEKFLVVTDVLNMPPEYFKSPSLLRFNNEFLNELDEYMEQVNRLHPGLRRLGLYHTHPGYGVFLSGTDVRTFEGIFKDPWQISMVVDPVNKEDGVFYWQEGRISPKNGFYIFKSKCSEFQLHKAADSNRLLRGYNRHSLEIPSLPDEEKEPPLYDSGQEKQPNEQLREKTERRSAESDDSINRAQEKQIDNANDSETDSTSDSNNKTIATSTLQSQNDKQGKDSIKRDDASEDNHPDDEAKNSSDRQTVIGQSTEDKNFAGDTGNNERSTDPASMNVKENKERMIPDKVQEERKAPEYPNPPVRGLG